MDEKDDRGLYKWTNPKKKKRKTKWGNWSFYESKKEVKRRLKKPFKQQFQGDTYIFLEHDSRGDIDYKRIKNGWYFW